MIPKKIHYCWFGGKEKPESVLSFLETWRRTNPDYEIKEWNESNFNYKDYTWSREAYSAKKWAYVSDVARIYALINEGGIYLDTDVEVLKSFDPYLRHHAFIGLENPYLIGTAVIGAEKGCEWLKEFFERYKVKSRHMITRRGVLNTKNNTAEITEFFASKFPNKLDVEIYDVDYFCGKLYYNKGLLYTSENTVAIHHFEATWMDNLSLMQDIIRRIKFAYYRLKADIAGV